jgi:hypothetical protein
MLTSTQALPQNHRRHPALTAADGSERQAKTVNPYYINRKNKRLFTVPLSLHKTDTMAKATFPNLPPFTQKCKSFLSGEISEFI